MTAAANPFNLWAVLVRDLRERVVAEMGEADVSPVAGDLLSSLEVLGRRCDEMAVKLRRLNEQDEAGWDAFLRALEKS